MGYIDTIRAAAKRWWTGFIPIQGATASADNKAILIDPAQGGTDGALRSAAYWACTRLISTSVGSLPNHIFEATPDGKVKALRHPAYNVLTQQPNPWMTAPQYYQSSVMGLCTHGNAYSLPDYLNGDLIGLWPLPPERVEIKVDLDGMLRYQYTDLNGRVSYFGPAEILHFRVFTLDGINGLAPLDYHRMTFGFETAAQTLASNLYANGGRPTGVLEYPNPLTPDQKKKIAESWTAMHAGPSNIGSTAILDGGMKYTAISVPLQQLEYANSQRFSIEQIARIFGVAPHLIGANVQPTYASVEQQALEFLRYTIQPIVVGIERTIQSALLEPPFSFRFNLAGFERSDIKSRYSAYAIARQWGFINVNEIRDLEEMNRIGPEGEVYLQPLNMIPAVAPGDVPVAHAFANAGNATTPANSPMKATP